MCAQAGDKPPSDATALGTARSCPASLAARYARSGTSYRWRQWPPLHSGTAPLPLQYRDPPFGDAEIPLWRDREATSRGITQERKTMFPSSVWGKISHSILQVCTLIDFLRQGISTDQGKGKPGTQSPTSQYRNLPLKTAKRSEREEKALTHSDGKETRWEACFKTITLSVHAKLEANHSFQQ